MFCGLLTQQRQIANVLSHLPDLKIFLHNLWFASVERFIPSADLPRVEAGSFSTADESVEESDDAMWTWDVVDGDDGATEEAFIGALFDRLPQLEIAVAADMAALSWPDTFWPFGRTRPVPSDEDERVSGRAWARDAAERFRHHFPPSLFAR